MDFGGDLAVLDPSIAFQIVNIAGLTGAMKFITVDNVARFNFKGGELVYATIETRKKKIGEFLVEQGYIDEKQLQDALDAYRKEKGRHRIGHYLIEHGHLDYKSLAAEIQEQMKEVVYEVLQWRKGQFIFFNNAQPEDEDILLDIKMDYLILEGLKRLDEATDR